MRVMGYLRLVGIVLGVAACKHDETAAETTALPAAATAALVMSSGAGAAASASAIVAADAPEAGFNPRLLRRFAPLRKQITAEHPSTEAQIALGRMLYFDKRLSKDRSVSCNSCHQLTAYGVDGEATSLGVRGQRGTRNSPTVYNAAGHLTQFWDGRASNVEEQAKGPIINPVEMAMTNGDEVVRMLRGIPGYVDAFANAFPGEPSAMSYDNLGRAIGAFERGLVTPGRWDSYLEGNSKALNSEEVEGLKVFTNVGCMVCHTGEFLGGSSYQRAGAVEPWPNQSDEGRFAVTKDPADRMMFKVPSLRNVARTGPYFHDGSAKTLDQAVRMMGKHQLGLELSEPEIKAIVSWLDTLTGEIPKEYITMPQLPPDATGKGPS